MPAPKNRSNGPASILDALHAAAPRREVNSCIPVNTYYRSAVLLRRQADQYRRARNQEQLYLMLLRYISLVLETIPRHSDYRKGDVSYQQLLAPSQAIMEELEQLKLKIKLDRAALEEAPYMPTAAPGAVKFGSNGAVSETPQIGAADLAALESLGTPGWAVALQTQPVAAPPGVPPPSSSFSIPDLTPSVALPPASGQILSKHAIVAIPGASATSPRPPQGQYPAQPPPPPAPAAPSYTELLASLQSGNAALASAPPLPSPYAGELALGPQAVAVQSASYPTGPLPAGSTCCQPVPSAPLPPTGTSLMPPPQPSFEPPPSTALQTRPSGGVAEVRKRQRLRDVHLSASLMKDFLRYADSNTRRNIETCGLLAGTLSPNDARFTITALIIPKQQGTSDTVETLAEEEIIEVQETRALYPLGWIHTHPTQTCFLSSVDVHTQCWYQSEMDEAVAIVMAPSQSRNSMGVFRLTTPGGLSLVQQCPRRGFHAHPPTDTGQPLYEECSNVYLNERVGYEVIDLRDK